MTLWESSEITKSSQEQLPCSWRLRSLSGSLGPVSGPSGTAARHATQGKRPVRKHTISDTITMITPPRGVGRDSGPSGWDCDSVNNDDDTR